MPAFAIMFSYIKAFLQILSKMFSFTRIFSVFAENAPVFAKNLLIFVNFFQLILQLFAVEIPRQSHILHPFAVIFAHFSANFAHFSAIFAQNACYCKISSYIRIFLRKLSKSLQIQRKCFRLRRYFDEFTENAPVFAKNLLVFANFPTIVFAVICSRNSAKIERFAPFCSNFRSFFSKFHVKCPFSQECSHISSLFFKY